MPVGPSYCDRRSSKRSMSCSSVAVPMMRDRAGVGHVGEERAERDRHGGAGAFDDAGDLFAEQAPAQRGFGTEHEQDVGAGQRDRPDTDGRPDDRTSVVLVETDGGTHGGEVGERFGVDLGEGVGSPGLDHRAQRRRGCVAGVVPAGERGNHHRPVEVGLGQPTDMFGSHGAPRYRCQPLASDGREPVLQ